MVCLGRVLLRLDDPDLGGMPLDTLGFHSMETECSQLKRFAVTRGDYSPLMKMVVEHLQEAQVLLLSFINQSLSHLKRTHSEMLAFTETRS